MADPDEIEEARVRLLQRLKAVPEINQEQGSDGGASASEHLHDTWTILDTPPHAESMTEKQLSQGLTEVAKFVENKPDEESNAALSYLTILADASRDVPILRSFYGLRVRPSDDENAVQLQTSASPDCVLELARRILQVQQTGLLSGIRRQALRIIANCCAYNNQNRSLIIGRHGVQLIRQFAFDEEDLDLVVPTLYNVCSDFDEGARDSLGKLIQTSDQMEAGWPATLSKAEQALGSFDKSSQNTATERLLALTPKIDPDQLPVLADVIEIASRPAIYGLGYMLDMADADSVQSSLKTLFEVMTEQSPELTLDEDARAATCQTYLNISSQPAAQSFLIQSPGDFAAFIRFPYLESEREDMYTKALLKITYAITSLPAYSETATPDSTIIGDAVKQIIDEDADLFALAPYLVLIANSLTNPDRIKQFHELHSFAPHLNDILTNTRNSNILLPALSICSRLIHIADARNDLFAAGILDSLAEILFSTPSSTSAKLRIPERNKETQRDQTLQVHRECLALIRLVVKGSPEKALSLLTSSSSTTSSSSISASTLNPTAAAAPHPPSGSIQVDLLSRILSLAQSTIDAQSKLEIGRLLVEILRCISSTNPTKPDHNQEYKGQPDLTVFTTTETIDAIVFLLTDGPAEVVCGEGLFGLGLVASLSTTSMTSASSGASVISAGGGGSASPLAAMDGQTETEADTAVEKASGVGTDQAGNQAVFNVIKSLSRQKDKVIPVLKKIVGKTGTGADGLDPSSTSTSTSTVNQTTTGVRAEVENLKYLLAHLLRVVGDRDNKETSTGAEVKTELEVDTDIDMGFVQELRGLEREMGLSSGTGT